MADASMILSAKEFAELVQFIGSTPIDQQPIDSWSRLKDSHAAQAERIEELKAAVIRRSGSSSWQEWTGIWDPTEETAVEATKRLFQRAVVAEAQLREISEQLEFDRTSVADCLTKANKAIDSRYWLTEGRGSHEWNDERWHKEFYAAAKEIKASLNPLTRIAADWTGCPQIGVDIVKSRVDLKSLLSQIREVLPIDLSLKLADFLDDLGEATPNGGIILHLESDALRAYAALLGSTAPTLPAPTWQQQAEREATDFMEKDGHRWVRMTTEEEAAKRLVESLG